MSAEQAFRTVPDDVRAAIERAAIERCIDVVCGQTAELIKALAALIPESDDR